MTEKLREWGPVRLTIEDRVGVLEFNDPDRRNAISQAMVHGLLDAMAELPALDIGCVMITGVGKAFSSGGDMASSDDQVAARKQGVEKGRDYTLDRHHHPVLRSLRDLPYPVVTAVNGPAIGMGMGYALHGDLILAARSAFFVAGFVNVGMSPDVGSSWLLPRMVGSARAREILMLGERISAEQAERWGMINRVFDDATFRDEAFAIARRLAHGPRLALSVIRKLSWQSWHSGFEDQIHVEEVEQMRLAMTDDGAEGMRAFLEKRKPAFAGR